MLLDDVANDRKAQAGSLAGWDGAPSRASSRQPSQAATVVAGVVVAAWLGWRLDALLGAPSQPGTAYSLAPAHVPVRWLEQFLFLPDPAPPEVHVPGRACRAGDGACSPWRACWCSGTAWR